MCVQNMGTNFGCVRASGYLLIVTSILAVSLTIADILVTYFLCPPNGTKDANCSTDDVWTWIASGIWTSLPVFAVGIWAIAWSFNTGKPGCFFGWLLGSVYFLLVPMMVCLTSVEAYKYKDSRMWSGGSYDKLPIPITLACLGFLEFLILFFLYNEVYCRKWTEEEYIGEPTRTTTTTTTTTTTPTIPTAAAATSAAAFPDYGGAYSTPVAGLPVSRCPVNVGYPNVAYAARMTTVMPSYGIYAPRSTDQAKTQVAGWNSPAFLYKPQGRLVV